MANFLPSIVYPSAVGYAQGRDLAKQNEGLPIVGNGWLAEATGRPLSSMLREWGSGATGLGFNNVSDILHSASNYISERMLPLKENDGSLDYYTSSNGLWGNMWDTGGAIAGFLLPTLAIPGGGIVRAGGRVLTSLPNLFRAGNYALRAPITLARRNGLKGIIPRLSKPTADWAVRNALSSPMEGIVEYGASIEDAIARGEDPEVARQKAANIVGQNIGFLTVTNAIEGGLTSEILRGKDWKRRLASALLSSGMQTYEEGGQRGFQMDAEGKPYTLWPHEMLTNPEYAEQLKEMKETAAPITALSLLGFTGGTAYRSIFGDRNKNSQKQNPPSQENPQPTQGDIYRKAAKSPRL